MSFKLRHPRWFQNDLDVMAINDETEFIKVGSYYNYLRRFPQQPIQLWTVAVESGGVVSYDYHIRLMADKQFPLHRIEVYDGTDKYLYFKDYKFRDKVTFDKIVLEGKSSDKFYVKVWYYGFDKNIAKGFPQDSTDTGMYAPNICIDKHAKDYGMFRRTYQIPSDDKLSSTFPSYYPYTVEQDYWLEKRLLSEYTIRDELVKTVVVQDINEVDILSLTVKDYTDVHTIYVFPYPTQNRVDLWEGDVFESYTGSIAEIVNAINANSKLVTASFIAENTEPFEHELLQIKTQGRLPEFGVLKSEIFAYLGVIPKIVDMDEYLIKFNTTEWNTGKWYAGDIYSPGSFYVEIPLYDVPSNFILLSMDDLQSICNKCKELGTTAIPIYTIEGSFEADAIVEAVETEVSFIKEFEANTGVALDSVITYNADGSVALNLYSPPPEGAIADTEISIAVNEEISLNASADTFLSWNVVEVIQQFLLSTTTDFGGLPRACTDVSSDQVTISSNLNYEYSLRNSNANWNVTDQPASSAILNWSWGLRVSGGTAVGWKCTNTSSTTWYGSNWLNLYGFGFDVPSNAQILGIQIEFNIYVGQTGDPLGTSWYLMSGDTVVGNGVGQYCTAGTTDYKAYTIGGSTNLWGGSWTPAMINNLKLRIAMGGFAPNGGYGFLDYVKVWVYWKYNNAVFCTGKTSIPTLESDQTGKWGQLSHSANIPSGTSIKYDVFKERIGNAQTTKNSTYNMGTTTVQKIAQPFTPSGSSLTGATINVDSIIGSPSDTLTLAIYTNNNGVPGTLIESWGVSNYTGDITKSYVNVNGLNTNATYWLVIERTGSASNSAYWKVGTKSSGSAFYWNGSSWTAMNQDIYFQLLYPVNLITGQSAPINLNNIEYTDIKVKGTLNTTNVANRPILYDLKLTREVTTQ